MRVGIGIGLNYQRPSFNPAALFSVAGSRGFFYDFSDYSTQFTDTAGTTAITGVGQSLGLVLDKSAGLAPGPELVTNGDFSSPTGWTLQTGWTIGGGVLDGNVAAAAFANAGTAVSLVAGRSYQITFTITSYTSGAVRSRISGGTDVFSTTDRSSVGTFTDILVAVAGNNTINMQARSAGFVGTIDNISVRELPGNHATQATAGSRPLTTTIGTGYRGVQFDGVDDFLQTAAIDFAGAESLGPELVTNGTFASNITGWSNVSDAGGTIAWNPLGYLDLINTTGTARAQQDFAVTSGRTYKFVVSNPGANTVDVYAGSTSGGGQLLTTTLTAGQTGTYIITATSSLMSLGFRNFGAGTTDSIDNVSVKEVLIAADKMTVVAGVRKLSDAARGVLIELTVNAGTVPNSFNIQAPGPATSYRIVSGGSLTAGAVFDATGLAAPRTEVLTGLANISGATASLRANGVQVAGGSAAQGTGNYANDIVYIGRRGGTSLPFNGILTFLCVINRTLTAGELAALEAYANSRTGAY